MLMEIADHGKLKIFTFSCLKKICLGRLSAATQVFVVEFKGKFTL